MQVVKNTCLLPLKNHKWSQISRETSSQKQATYSSLGKVQKNDKYPNNYIKKFNLRKINRTHNSVKKKMLQIEESKADDEECHGIMHKITQSLDSKKNKKGNNLKAYTDKMRNKTTQIMKQPQCQRRRSHEVPSINHDAQENQPKYQHLTPFERLQISSYETVYYIGKRRIYSTRDFTDKHGDPKVAANDGIMYRYQVLDIIGKGSFGQVFKAFDYKKKELCALKIIRNQPKFCTQAKIQIKLLQHVLTNDKKMKSNIIQLKQSFFFRGHPCLVFELLHQNLYQFIKEHKFTGLTLDLILRITIQVLQGLLYFRKYSIIHCDLKPENILLKNKNKTGIKIIDVGSGCYQREQRYTYIQSRYYRAPEIIFGISYTCAIDMWSLGCIVVELFQGVPLFPGEDEYQQIAMFMQLLGVPPTHMLDQGSRSTKFFKNHKPRIIPNKKGIYRKPGTKILKDMLEQCQNQEFVDFVGKCLVWEPEKRITPNDALFHPWIMQGIPEEIKKQHIHQIQKNCQV